MFCAESKPLFSVSGTLVSGEDSLLVENRDSRIRFENESAELMTSVLPLLDGCSTLAGIAVATGFSVEKIAAHLAHLEEDALIVDWAGHLQVSGREQYVRLIRAFSAFYNQQIFSNSPARAIFGMKSDSHKVIGWGIEFYFFVRAANDYMPRAIQSLCGGIDGIEPLLAHYVEEALHEEIFLRGLKKCGFDENKLARRMPLVTTMSLVNHLYEHSSRGPLSYAALFAVMQPKEHSDPAEAIRERYDELRNAYPLASGIFDAFEEHDCIDAGLEHSELLLDKIAQVRGLPSRDEMLAVMTTIQRTAFQFMLFYKGIDRSYRDETSLRAARTANSYGLVPN